MTEARKITCLETPLLLRANMYLILLPCLLLLRTDMEDKRTVPIQSRTVVWDNLIQCFLLTMISKYRGIISKKKMESSIHLCWSSEAELGELQLMGEGLKWEKKKVRVKWEKAVREKQRWKNSKQKLEELTTVQRAKQRMSEKQLKVFQEEKVPNSNAGKKIPEHITTSETMQMCNTVLTASRLAYSSSPRYCGHPGPPGWPCPALPEGISTCWPPILLAIPTWVRCCIWEP